MKNKLLSLLLGAAALVGAISSCKEPAQPKTPSASVTAVSQDVSSAVFEVSTENIYDFAYLVTEAATDAPTEALFVYRDGVTGQLDESGHASVTISGLNPVSEYNVTFAFKIDEQTYFSAMLKENFTTKDVSEDITLLGTYADGFKLHIRVPESVKNSEGKRGIRYGIGSLAMYLNGKNSMWGGISPDSDMLLMNGQKWITEDTTFDWNDNNLYELDENGNEILDEWSGEPVLLHTPFIPGEPIILTAGEYEWTDEDLMGWGYGGYFIPMYDTEAYYEAIGGGGWGPWSAEFLPSPEFEDDPYWTGFFTRKLFRTSMPETMEEGVTVDYAVGATKGTIRLTPDPKVVRYSVFITPDHDLDMYLDQLLLGNEEYMQWFVASYPGAMLAGCMTITDVEEPTELVLEDMYYLEPETDYHLFITSMGSEDGMIQSFQHETFKTTAKTMPAPEISVSAISNPSGTESPYEVWFNVKCTSHNAFSGKYAANYEREWAMTLNQGLDYNSIAAQGNRFSDADIAQINSAEGMDMMFSTLPGQETRLAILLFNEEETCNTLEEGCSAMAIAKAIDEPAKEKVESSLFDDLTGDWTMTANPLKSVYNNTTFDYDWVSAGEQSCKVSISKGFTYPETLTEDVYETYNKLLGMDKAGVDALYDEFKAEVDIFNKKLESQNQLVALGFGFDNPDDYYGPWYTLRTPYDLFCSDSYNGYDNQSILYDCGPKWFIEIKADGSVTVPFSDTFMYPMSVPGYYPMYLTATNLSDGYISGTGSTENPYLEFPINVASDKQSFTWNPLSYNGADYYPTAMYFMYGYGYAAGYTNASELSFTKGYTEPAQTASVKAGQANSKPVQMSSANGRAHKASSPAKRKTSFKAMKKFNKLTYEIKQLKQNAK